MDRRKIKTPHIVLIFHRRASVNSGISMIYIFIKKKSNHSRKVMSFAY